MKRHSHALFTSEHAERNDLIFIESAQKDAIHFQRPQTGAPRRTNSSEHVIVSAGYSRDARETVGIDCIHGNRHPREPRILQRLRFISASMCPLVVSAMSSGSGNCRTRREPSRDRARREPSRGRTLGFSRAFRTVLGTGI